MIGGKWMMSNGIKWDKLFGENETFFEKDQSNIIERQKGRR